jgi:hypothetical protein
LYFARGKPLGRNLLLTHAKARFTLLDRPKLFKRVRSNGSGAEIQAQPPLFDVFNNALLRFVTLSEIYQFDVDFKPELQRKMLHSTQLANNLIFCCSRLFPLIIIFIFC